MQQPRVFLSSTFSDLIEYRKTVQAAIRQLGALDVAMEHFGARDERPTDECVRLVRDESDLFVGIYAHRYGYIPDGDNISISEMEYRAASDAPLPRFIYLVNEEQPWLPGLIDGGDKAEKLRLFKAMLLKRHICPPFGSKDQLATMVVADIGRHIAMQNSPKIDPEPVPLPDILRDSMFVPDIEMPGEWNSRRNDIYNENRGIFLAHVIRPSSKHGQKFDVYIYLIRHEEYLEDFVRHEECKDFADVRSPSFF
jgi:hypothetical protein